MPGLEQKCLNNKHVKLLIPVIGTMSIRMPDGGIIIDDSQMYLLPARHTDISISADSDEGLVIEMPESYSSLYLCNMFIEREGVAWAIGESLWPVKKLLIHEAAHDNREEAVLLLNYLLCKKTEQSVSRSLHYIHQHYTEKIEIRDLAAMEHYTQSYYCGWFKRKMSMTPLEYIHALRIRRAKELLRDPELSVLAVSYLLGYEYNASFTKMFKKHERQSPSEYRAALQS